MNTLNVRTTPTPDLNVYYVSIDLEDFDAHSVVSFICTLKNDSNNIIDRRSIIMDGIV